MFETMCWNPFPNRHSHSDLEKMQWRFTKDSFSKNVFLVFCSIQISLCFWWLKGEGAQSREGAKVFLQSLELGLPHFLTRMRERGWGVPIPTRGFTLWYSVCTLWEGAFSATGDDVLYHFSLNLEQTWNLNSLKVHKNENFLAPILNFVLFHC